MADIAKCNGHDCPLKEKCYRFTALSDEIWQTWGGFSYVKDKGCDHYWEVKS